MVVLVLPRAAAADERADQLWQQADHLLQRRQNQAAMPLLQEAARGGNARAQTTLGNIYHNGAIVPKDDGIAMQWYMLGAAQGHRFAEYSLGNGYMLGIGGLPVDQRKATQLFEASARQGLVDAQEAIAMSYELGRGTARDRGRAIYWLDQASARDDIYARGFAKILRNPNTPVFASLNQVEGFVYQVFQYCWRGQFPFRRPDLDRPGIEVWEHIPYNWRNTYCN